MGLASGPLPATHGQALYHASAATVAPMSYTNMLWAILIGYLWFGDVPTLSVLAGSAVVIAATALLVRSVQPARGLHTKSACDARVDALTRPIGASTQSPKGRAGDAAGLKRRVSSPGPVSEEGETSWRRGLSKSRTRFAKAC